MFNKKINIVFILNLALTFLFYWLALSSWDDVPEDWEIIVSLLALSEFVVNILSIRFLKLPIFDYRIWYSLMIQVFTFGRIYLVATGNENYLIWDSLPYNYTLLDNWRAGLIALISTQSFWTGMNWVNCKYKKDELPNMSNNYSKLVFNTGIILVILLLPFKLINDYQNFIFMQVTAAYGSAEVNGVVGNLALLYPIGFIFLICSKYWSNKICLKYLIIYSVIMIAISVYTGDRRNVMTSIISQSLCYIYVYRPKINIVKCFVYSIIAFFVLYLMVVIRELRIDSSGSLSTLVVYLLENNSTGFMDIIWMSFAEYGITFYTYSNAIMFYPSISNYFYGATYLLMPLITIPGIGLLYPSINDLTSTSKIPEEYFGYSVGGSFGQEAYANFGILGGLFLLFLGIWFGKKVIYLLYSNNVKDKIYYFLFLYFFLSLPRASFLEFSRQIVWTIFILESIFYFKSRRIGMK